MLSKFTEKGKEYVLFKTKHSKYKLFYGIINNETVINYIYQISNHILLKNTAPFVDNKHFYFPNKKSEQLFHVLISYLYACII